MGPLTFSVGIRSLLRDLASALRPHRLILVYLDYIYILSPDDLAQEQTLAFFDDRQPFIRLNPTKCKSLGLDDIKNRASECWAPAWARTVPESGPSRRRVRFRGLHLESGSDMNVSISTS